MLKTDKQAGDASANYSSSINSSTLLAFHVATYYNNEEVMSFNWHDGAYVDNYKITTYGVDFADNIINKSKGLIRVYYPHADDSLWSVAKQHNVDKSHIERVNGLSGTIEGREYIII